MSDKLYSMKIKFPVNYVDVILTGTDVFNGSFVKYRAIIAYFDIAVLNDYDIDMSSAKTDVCYNREDFVKLVKPADVLYVIGEDGIVLATMENRMRHVDTPIHGTSLDVVRYVLGIDDIDRGFNNIDLMRF